MTVKKTPFHELGLKMGAQMVELFGYYLPWQYSAGHYSEHLATRSAASLCDLHYMAEFVVSGPQSLPFVEKIATANLTKKGPGSIKYSCFCNEKGMMIDDGTIWCTGRDEYLIITGDESDYSWFSSNAKDYEVEINNVTDAHTTLALQGPKSFKILSKIVSAPLDQIKYYHFIEADVAGVRCKIARMGYTGEYGFELHCSTGAAAAVWNKLFEVGAEHGLVPLGQAGLESLRQEAGYILVGNDHDKQTNPLEAGQGWTVDFAKAEFLGKRALEKVRELGLTKTLVWFDVPGQAVMGKGDLVRSGSKEIGRVTSGSYSPGRKSGTAMAYVRPEYAINGVSYTLVHEETAHTARLSIAALYDPGNVKTKSLVK